MMGFSKVAEGGGRRPSFPRLGPAVVLLAALDPLAVAGQEGSAQAPRDWSQSLPEAREIALARSAAAPSVSDSATIYVLQGGEFRVAVEGTNGNACLVSRTHPESLEPICYDREGAGTLLLIEKELVERLIAGEERASVDEEIAMAIGTGRLKLPGRPSLAYMLSSAQRLVGPNGPIGPWRPHTMLYWPYLDGPDLGLAGSTPTVFVAMAGTPLAHLITAVPEFVDPVWPEGHP